MKSLIEQLVAQALSALPADVRDAAAGVPIEIERTRDRQHGDYACNIAMRLAKPLRAKPRDIARDIVDRVPESEAVDAIWRRAEDDEWDGWSEAAEADVAEVLRPAFRLMRSAMRTVARSRDPEIADRVRDVLRRAHEDIRKLRRDERR